MYNHWNNKPQTLANLEKFDGDDGQILTENIDIYKGAADLYLSLDLPKESALLYKKWGKLKDSLQAYTNRVQLNELEDLYFNERSKNEEITLKNKELEQSRSSQATMGLGIIALLIIGGGLVYFIRMNGLKENQKLKVALKNKQMEQLMDVQETERQRIARELHDGIGQSLAALKMQIQFNDKPNASLVAVERIDSLCNEVRSLSHQMMPLVLKENGLKSAVQQLLETSFSNSEIEVSHVVHGFHSRLTDKVEIHLYRIVQELISNILKHANATKVGVQLLQRDGLIILIAEDNGVGFDQKQEPGGIGVSNISSRVEAMEGTLKIRSSKNTGTCVHIAIPFSAHLNKKTA